MVRDVGEWQSNDADRLALMKRPELGVTFSKLNVWKLTQYKKVCNIFVMPPDATVKFIIMSLQRSGSALYVASTNQKGGAANCKMVVLCQGVNCISLLKFQSSYTRHFEQKHSARTVITPSSFYSILQSISLFIYTFIISLNAAIFQGSSINYVCSTGGGVQT